MAEDLRLRLIFEGKDAKRNLERFNKVMRETDDVAKQSTTSFNEFQGKILGFGAQFAAAAAIIAAEKKVFDFAREGASADLARRQFGELAEELGTTADDLLPRLRQETDGLISNFGAMQQATDFLRLGLVDTEDQLVRLTAASAELGFDLNELTLALANQSKRRLDQLGISVTVFNQKLAELEEQGLSTNEAFTEAFLLAAEEQIERVGSTSDTAAGEIRRLESSWEDLRMTGAQLTSRALAPMIENLNDLIFAYRNAEGPVDLWLDANVAILNAYRNMIGLQPIVIGQQEGANTAIEGTGQSMDLASSSARGFRGEMALVGQTAGASMSRAEEETSEGVKKILESLNQVPSIRRIRFLGDISNFRRNWLTAIEAYNLLPGVADITINPFTGGVVTVPGMGGPEPSDPTGRGSGGGGISGGGGSTRSGDIGLAGGGPLHPLSLVGERGPELIINGVVIDAQTTRRLMQLGVTPQQKLATAGGLIPGQTSGSGGGGIGPGPDIQMAGLIGSGGAGTSPGTSSFGTTSGGASVQITSGGGGGGGGAQQQQASAEQTISAVAQTAAQATQQTSAQVINQLQRAERIGRGTNNRLDRVIELLADQASADELRSINLETQDTSRF